MKIAKKELWEDAHFWDDILLRHNGINHNKIYHGDCLEWMKRIDDNSIDMILQQPLCIEKEKKFCEIGLKRINENRKRLRLV